MEAARGRTSATWTIQRKLKPPRRPASLVERPRLTELILSLIEGHAVVLVCATAGAGKTTAVAEAVRSLDCRVGWLTLEETDSAAGRLLEYIEAAINHALPDIGNPATRALAQGIPHPEAAGLLAEAVGEQRLVLVLDDMHRLGDNAPAWAVIESLVRWAPPGLSIVLTSRHDVPANACDLLAAGRVPGIGEADLALTATEAAEVLRRLGSADLDAAEAVDVTGGWVTGVLFEVWRSADHVVGVGGEADPLSGYLSAQILERLPPQDRDFLVRSSLLDVVTRVDAEALGLVEAGERLRSIRAAHLPVAWETGGGMRCHTRFREYLLELLHRRDPGEVRRLREAHAALLARMGQDEDATEEFLRASAPEQALGTAERAIFPVIERLDLDIAERWLTALGEVRRPGAGVLTTAELMMAIARDDYRAGVRIADDLEQRGERDAQAAASPRAAALMAWSYLHSGRPEDADAVLACAESAPETEVIRYARLLATDQPVRRPRMPAPTGGPLDALSFISTYYLGRLDELSQPADTPWATVMSAPFRVAALRALGRTQEALDLYNQLRTAGPTSVAFDATIAPEVLLDSGQHEAAWAALARGRERAQRSGSSSFLRQNLTLEAKMALRLDHDPDRAREILDQLELSPGARVVRHGADMLDTWYGLALLQQGADGAALERLRRAVAGMVAGGRDMDLPTAAVYLAEAEWRAGDERAADRAARLALEAAKRQGSNHQLLQALRDFPDVAARQIDAEPDVVSVWHEIGRAVRAQSGSVTAALQTVRLVDFGTPRLLVDDNPVKPGLAKAYELLALLCSRRGDYLSRDDLLDALFEGRGDRSARSYLRQVIERLRGVLPAGAQLNVVDGHWGIGPDSTVTSDSGSFEAALAEAGRFTGQRRLVGIREALRIYDRGVFLPEVESAWANERRQTLAKLAEEARYEAAEAAFSAGRLEEAWNLCLESLRDNPYREGAWRLRMRIANALGDDDGVIAAFQQCAEFLGELQTAPSPGTRKLLESLRR